MDNVMYRSDGQSPIPDRPPVRGRHPTEPSLLRKLLAGAGKLAVTTVLVGLGSAIAAPAIADQIEDHRSSCARPVGLRQVDLAGKVLSGDYRLHPELAPGTKPRADLSNDEGGRKDQFGVWRVLDGRFSSHWAVGHEAGALDAIKGLEEASDHLNHDKGIATLVLERKGGESVAAAMVCVVNGLPSDPASYHAVNRIRDLHVSVTCDGTTSEHVVQLKSQGDDNLLEPQDLRIQCEHVDEMRLTIASVYYGQTVTDTNTGKRIGPTHFTALSELTMYERDPGYGTSLIGTAQRKVSALIKRFY